MALQADQTHQQNVSTFQQLTERKARIVHETQAWMNLATGLVGNLTDNGEKQEVAASRADLIAQLRAVLGV